MNIYYILTGALIISAIMAIIIYFNRKIKKHNNDELRDTVGQKEFPNQMSPMEDNYIFDLQRSYWNSPTRNGRMTTIHVNANDATGEMPQIASDEISDLESKQKLFVKPIEIVDELKEKPKLLSTSNIDEKIAVLNDKKEFINNNYAKNQVEGMIFCLENRKQYDAHKSYFAQFDTTSLEKIEELLKKYSLVMKEADLFIPEFPDEAIKIMKSYAKKIKDITGKKPVFYVIATDENFQQMYKDRDPILLAQSIFGFYYDILGAWDKEMIVLKEL